MIRSSSTSPSTRRRSHARRGRLLAALLVAICGAGAITLATHHLADARTPLPSARDFGLGPRASSRGTYLATLLPDRPLSVGALQAVSLSVVDASGREVAGAAISIDGGMPQHGHGLPTRPRVAPTSSAGVYRVSGLRFNMGGWWVLTFGISAAAGTDSVTFNLKL